MSLSTINTTPTSTVTTTKGNGNAQACAACKYQRRKCAADCLLAPYFPHDSQRQFLNAHRLFGVSNITKIIKHLHDPRAKDDAMRTIIFQSDARASDPVGGCHRIIRELHRQIDLAKAELDFLLHHLALYRAAAAAQQQQEQHDGGGAGGVTVHESCHFFQSDQQQQYQDDVSSWVVQDSSSDLKQDVVDVNVDVDVDVKPFDRRDEAVLRPVADFSIQQANDVDVDDLRDATILFTVTNSTS